MAGWVALSDRALPLDGLPAARWLRQGRLILEIALPLTGPLILAEQERDGTTLALFLGPDGQVTLWHRGRTGQVRLSLHLAASTEPGLVRLTLHWDARAGLWDMTLEDGRGPARQVQAASTLPLHLPDLLALCAASPDTRRHPALLWFGVTEGAPPPDRAPWIGPNTPVATPEGYRRAADLQPGDLVSTDDGPRRLKRAQRLDLPARGHYAPVLLRAPFFGLRRDLLVSADQSLLLRGPEIEYLLGEEKVLAEARHLTCGAAALFDTRRAVATGIHLDLGEPRILSCEGVAFALAGPQGLPALRALRSYEAVALYSQTGGGQRHRAA